MKGFFFKSSQNIELKQAKQLVTIIFDSDKITCNICRKENFKQAETLSLD